MDRMTCDRALLWVCFVALLGRRMVRKGVMPCGPTRYRGVPGACGLMVQPRQSKPGVPRAWVRGWGDAGCGVFAFSSQLCQPCFGNVLCFLYGSEVLGNAEEVLRIPSDLWCPLAASCLTESFLGVGGDPWLSWDGLFNGCL
jgi:hypothetical protein